MRTDQDRNQDNRNKLTTMTNTMSYYRRYLELLKRQYGSGFLIKDGKLDELADAAEERYEEARRDGLTVGQAQELAMEVLLEGIEIQEEQDGIQ